MTKFAHISDIHLDNLQYNLEARRQDFFLAFKDAIETCVKENVDFIILGGDLFHHRNSRNIAIYHAIECLRLATEVGIPIFSIIGNHEYKLQGDSLDTQTLLDHLGFIQMLNPLESVVIDNIAIRGIDWTNNLREEIRSVSDRFLKEEPNKFRLLVAHGALVESDNNHKDISDFYYSDVEETVHYLALGHIHKPYVYGSFPICANPGSLETNSTTELKWEDRGFFLVTINNTYDVEIKTVKSKKRSFVKETLIVANLTEKEIAAKCQEIIDGLNDISLLKIELIGTLETPLNIELIKSLLEIHSTINTSILVDNTQIIHYLNSVNVDTDDISPEKTLKAILNDKVDLNTAFSILELAQTSSANNIKPIIDTL